VRLTNDAAAPNVSAAIPGCGFKGVSAMIFPSLVEDTIADNQHPAAEPSRQRFLGHKGNHCYLACIELIDAAENGTPHHFEVGLRVPFWSPNGSQVLDFGFGSRSPLAAVIRQHIGALLERAVLLLEAFPATEVIGDLAAYAADIEIHKVCQSHRACR
jgi:hypothetical protein